jgi:hypothetical protein
VLVKDGTIALESSVTRCLTRESVLRTKGVQVKPNGQSNRRWRTIALLAIGVSLGTMLTATPVYSHVGGTVSHLWAKHIRPKADVRYANATPGTDKAKDADRLDGRDLSAFAPAFRYECSGGEFLRMVGPNFSSPSAQCASDVLTANELDGLDSTQLLRSETYSRSVSGTGSNLGCAGDAMCQLIVKCDGNNQVISGGFTNVDPGTFVLTSMPWIESTVPGHAWGVGWFVQWHNNSTLDTVEAWAVCTRTDKI